MLKDVWRKVTRSLPLGGYPPSKPVPLIDMLSDEQLEELNRTLNFNCFTVDSRGRRFGAPAGPSKRTKPQSIPDKRITWLDQQVGLAGKKVLEVGCFEGVHTIALAKKAASVVALDSRVENVVKTMVRTSFYDVHARVAVFDLETLSSPLPEWLHTDVVFHVGVLYHLTDPVSHLKVLSEGIRDALYLDTHVAKENECTAEYESDGENWKYFRFKEVGYKAVFAGMKDHAKWVREEDLIRVLMKAGFREVQTAESRDQRQGKRVSILARK